MRYSANTPSTQKAMLDAIGVTSIDDLLSTVPEEVRTEGPLDIAGPWAEADLRARLEDLKSTQPRHAFVGAGLYDHYIPTPVESLAGRSEWVTSYTPYQAELAQGTLTMYYEFQTYIACLTGQEIANSGMYDGSTALAEAVLMAMRVQPKADPVVYVSKAVHPHYLAVLRTYMRFVGVEIVTLDIDKTTGRTIISDQSEEMSKSVAVVLQSPNFMGVVEDTKAIPDDAFKIGVCTEALAMAITRPLDVDIMVGECQSFGIPIQLGGPTAGFFATRKKWVRKMPGRLVGRTVDSNGDEAFCITLATREQFIRREKATSNICTSSGLMCLRATIYLSLLGGAGLEELARKNAATARFFVDGLARLGVQRVHSEPYFNELALDFSACPDLIDTLLAKNIVMGLPLSDFFEGCEHHYLCAFTETSYSRAAAILEEISSHA